MAAEPFPAMLGLFLVLVAVAFAAGTLFAGRMMPPRGNSKGIPERRVLVLLALVGAMAGLASLTAGTGIAIALGEARHGAPWSWLTGPDLLLALCAGVAFLLVREHAGAGHWWLVAPGVALIVPCVILAPVTAATGGEALRLGVVAAVASGVLLSPGRRAQRIAQACWDAVLSTGDGVVVVDDSSEIIEVTGEAAESLVASPSITTTSSGRRHLPGLLEVRLSDPETRTLRVRAGSDRFLELWKSGPPAENTPGHLRALVVRDITKQYRDEKNLKRLAHYDSLTGLANRRLFLDHIKRDLTEAVRADETGALLYIDLDNFREVNDSLGHAVGDAVLEQIASRLSSAMRGSDKGPSLVPRSVRTTVARLSADEFAIVISKVSDGEGAREIAHHILELIAEPINADGRSLVTSARVGIALFPKDGEDVQSLIRAADGAVDEARKRGRGRVAFYEPTIETGRERITRIADELGHAIERDELSLHYQPRVDAQSGTVVAFEALMRWFNEELGDVSPMDFIPAAEERGLINELGSWAIEEACRQIASWREEGFDPVAVSVNVSSVQFRGTDLPSVVSRALESNGVEAELLELEVTEGLLLDGAEDTATCLRDLRAMGVRISLDDFGTGYSALSYLNQFPLDVLKMDRDFLSEIHVDAASADVAAAIVSMAHGLSLSVVAEGVDSEEQLEVLRQMSCDQIQGFLFSAAVPPEDTLRFLASGGADPPRLHTANHPGRQAAEDSAPVEEEGPRRPTLEEALAAVRAGAREEPTTPSILIMDDGQGALRSLAERLTRIAPSGIDLHYVQAAHQARPMVEQQKLDVRLIVVPPSGDLELAATLARELSQRLHREPQLVVVGDEPGVQARARLREQGVSFVLWTPYDDTELIFVLKSALTEKSVLARRVEIRVPVDITARMRAGTRREVVVLSCLSRRGAFIELSEPLGVNARIQLEFELGGEPFRFFARVVYQEREVPDRPLSSSGNGVVFYGSDREAELRISKLVEERGVRFLP